MLLYLEQSMDVCWQPLFCAVLYDIPGRWLALSLFCFRKSSVSIALFFHELTVYFAPYLIIY